MADLSPGGGDRRDRGQLVLIGGIAIAVALVVLVLLVNTAIYTENLATRDVDTGGDDALAFRTAVVSGVGDVVDAENRREYADRGALEENVTADVDRMDELLARQAAESGAAARVGDPTLHEGQLVRQTDGSRGLTASGGATNWTVADDVSDVRGYSATVTGGLTTTGDPAADAFRVRLDDGTDQWDLYVYDDGGLTLAVANGSETTPGTVCPGAYSGTPVTINLTAGTVDGTDCPGLAFAKGVGTPYDLEYRYGARAEGTYDLTVNVTAPAASVNDAALNDGPGASSPYNVSAVYSVSTEVRYETADLLYNDTVRVAPGEPA